MALVYPSRLPIKKHNGGLFREIEVIERLAQSLPEEYEIYHSVEFHTVEDEHDQFGEIDVVVLDPVGKILLVEIKAGPVTLRDGSFYKHYPNGDHNVSKQCRIQYAAMRNRLMHAGIVTTVNSCLVMPDYSIFESHIVSIPNDRIIDARTYDNIGRCVREFLATGYGCKDLSVLRHFLRNEFKVSTDLAVLKGQLQDTVRLLSDGLATWVPRIRSSLSNTRIQATAGSGKTQLALKLMTDSLEKNLSVAYVCYNRPLADHLRSIGPTRAMIINFHELCVEHYRRHHEEPDFNDAEIFDKVTLTYIADSENFTARYDILIIDEAQDFNPNWLSSLSMLLEDEGQLYVMEDDDQRLYETAKFDLEDTVQITCNDNFRSPKEICRVINAFGLSSAPIQSKSPYLGTIPNFYAYKTEEELLQKTEAAVTQTIARGFRIEDIVILTGRGRSKSTLLNRDSIGPYQVRRFTGKYTKNGDPIWSEGHLSIDSIYRFKGQSAPAVILSEVSFTELTPLEKRKLFVGMTRAQMNLEIVLKDHSEKILMDLLV
ncbi:ATP-binding domain-containing protein [Undibacterium seohonense]|uniref:DNA 3'-5' helicase II n=1 Tax=Undibacterium seohonense TaxID=1344950 RepID=A0ABR6WZH7_9BURK|nr:ATP-binding domain-containing protein [Undibacterium seohonense]MBC3805798.1 ATP-binding domain-containing protein [Undibacterium seohonense]